MKLKFRSLLAGVIATVVIAATPLVAAAQAQSPQAAQDRPRIVLSEQQQQQFEQLQANAIAQIQGILDEEQKAQFTTGLQNGQGLGAVNNLSEQQVTQIQTVLNNFNTQIGEILTPDQKRQIEESVQNQE